MAALRVLCWLACPLIPLIFHQFFWTDLFARQHELRERRQELQTRITQSQKSILKSPEREKNAAQNRETLQTWLEMAGWRPGQPYEQFLKDCTNDLEILLAQKMKAPTRSEDYALFDLAWEGPAADVIATSEALLQITVPTRLERYSFTRQPNGRARAEGRLAALWLPPLPTAEPEPEEKK